MLFGACRLPNWADSVFLSATLLPGALSVQPPDRDQATGLLTPEALREAARRASGDDGGGAGRAAVAAVAGYRLARGAPEQGPGASAEPASAPLPVAD